jgi:RNA-directed DNA polymerase
MSDIIKTQRSFAIKAQYNPAHRFDHLYRLICQDEWIATALDSILANTGARTPGIDGVTKRTLATEEVRRAFIDELREDLRTGRFRPVPVRRVFIPKANGKQRPLGILTLKDRVVQYLLKMLLEPIWESDFLNCSNGFRPGRRTMDCIALLDSYITKRSKYFWVIEGDIKGAFDNIHQTKLQELLAERIADRRILTLIASFLKAGMMEGPLFRPSERGVPQGAPLSPLLANVYLHHLDRYWWERYGKLHRKDKERRRLAHQGNCALIRYADDWLLLTNGSRAEAERLRDEFQAFLADDLHLELSVEKTHITHVNDGFDFLGFHVRRYVGRQRRPTLLVTPSKPAQARFKAKIKEMTARKRYLDVPLLKFSALNAVLRGWITYYRHSNAKHVAKDLDYFVNERLFLWLQKRHRLGPRRILALYKQHQHGRRYNWGIRNGEQWLYLYRMSDQPLTKYRSRKPPNPYVVAESGLPYADLDTPLPLMVWLGNAQNNETWRELKAEVKAERGARCEHCGSRMDLDLHHLKARRAGGQDAKDNAQLLCERCHVHTPTYGRYPRRQ